MHQTSASLLKLVVFGLCVIVSVSNSCHANDTLQLSKVETFLVSILGDWKGQAIETPLGPRPYDISFKKDPYGHVKGQTGINSIHYWDFSHKGEVLKLKFLTTFAGNTEPLLFESRQYNDHEFIFESISRNDVQVLIKLQKQAMTIRIYLKQKLHVLIQLAQNKN